MLRFALVLLAAFTLRAAPAQYDLMIQGAIDWELQPLLAALEHRQERQISGWSYWTGNIGPLSVVVSQTEMGPINAAASTTLAIERFHPKAIVNQGTAGAHDPALHVFDIVLGEKTIDYTAFKSDPNGSSVPIYHKIHGVVYPGFPGDAALLAAAEKTPYPKGKVVKGVVGSGFQYNREIDHMTWLHRTYGTTTEDMESAYVAGVAAGMQVPFLAIRIVSDSEWNHPQLERKAGEYCAEFVVNFVRRLATAYSPERAADPARAAPHP